jgi:hypothetical protein
VHADPEPRSWDMKRSTVLYTCNNTGMHDVSHAVEYGTVVYDWSCVPSSAARSTLSVRVAEYSSQN